MGIYDTKFNEFNFGYGDYSIKPDIPNKLSSSFSEISIMTSPSISEVSDVFIGTNSDVLNAEVKQNIDDIVHVSDVIDKELKRRFPKGCKLVGLGRSPAIVLEILKEKGYETVHCPLSGLMTGEYDISGKYSYLRQLDRNDVLAYKNFLDKIGLTADKVYGSSQPIVVVDYTRTGNSLRSFSDLLSRPEIGIRQNINYLSLNKDLMPNKSVEDLKIIDRLWENLNIKKYSLVPRVEISEIGKVQSIVDSFQISTETKQFLNQLKKFITKIR